MNDIDHVRERRVAARRRAVMICSGQGWQNQRYDKKTLTVMAITRNLARCVDQLTLAVDMLRADRGMHATQSYPPAKHSGFPCALDQLRARSGPSSLPAIAQRVGAGLVRALPMPGRSPRGK